MSVACSLRPRFTPTIALPRRGGGSKNFCPETSPCPGGSMHLGNKLRRMRQARGLTAVELAQRARVTTGFISQLEHSQTVPSLHTLQRLGDVLGVSLTYFLLEENLQPQVVRKQERPILHLEDNGSCVSLLS